VNTDKCYNKHHITHMSSRHYLVYKYITPNMDSSQGILLNK